MQPKKSLGQNFLKDEKVLNHIIQKAVLKMSDNVIEIGPGEGALSKLIRPRVKNFVMIEKDDFLAEKISNEFQLENRKQIDPKIQRYKFQNGSGIINGDILEINLPHLIEENTLQNYKLIANIPYYITSPIIRLFLETKYPPKEMILMVQKEVAERICAGPGEHSILSVSVQYYAEAEILFEVSRKSFWPAPDVDSAVIRIVPSGNRHTQDSKNFFRIVRAGFSAKRKTLLNNLSTSFHLDKKEMEEKIKKAGIIPSQRAQELDIDDWKNLTKVLS